VSVAVLSAQAPVQFRSSSDTVEVHATVKLKNGTIARDLEKDSFELFEDGKAREITVFSKSIQPLSAALVLDHSGSTAMQFDDVMSASQEFIGHLLRGDRAAISSLVWDCHPFTEDMQSLMTILRMPMPSDFGSPIWAATDRAMSSLSQEPGRHIILLLSDGQDNQSPMAPNMASMVPPRELTRMSPCEFAGQMEYRTAADVIKRAERDEVMVYTVSVGEGTGDLDKIAKQTGASYQRLAEYNELKGAFRSIADELHLQYLLGFTPSFTDGKMHKIEVKVKRSGVTVQARKGYVATAK
jgi:VWFA-related protein